MSRKPEAIKSAFNSLQGKLKDGEIPVWVDPVVTLTNMRVITKTGLTGSKIDWEARLEEIDSAEAAKVRGMGSVKFVFGDGSTKEVPQRNVGQAEDLVAAFLELKAGEVGTATSNANSIISEHNSEKFGASTNWSKALPGWLARTIEQNRIGDEPVEVIIVGDVAYAGALVGFSDRCMILKGGAIGSFMSNSFGGGRATTFYYKQITGIEFNGGMMSGVLEVLTASYQGTANKDFWKGISTGFKPNVDGNDPWTLSNTLPMSKITFNQSKPQIDILRKKISDAQSPSVIVNQQGGADLASQLQKLSLLHEQGILSADEFQKAKSKLLDI